MDADDLSDEVGTDMLKQLSASIHSGDIQIISMKMEGDGDCASHCGPDFRNTTRMGLQTISYQRNN